MPPVTDFRRGLRAYAQRTHLHVPPPDAYEQVGDAWVGEYASYSHYNYFGDSLIHRVKAAHFEAALALARDRFGQTGAIDFGTADGFLLPTLSRHFDPVLAVDVGEDQLAVARRAAEQLRLANVATLCNAGMSFDDLRARVDAERYGVMFVLETLEHVGTKDDMIASRVAFVRELFTLLQPGGRVIISVPNMVGLTFALQRAVLAATGGVREPIGKADLARAVVLKDTRRLEPEWNLHKHLGFNHRLLERALRAEFDVVAKRDLVVSKVYAVQA